MDDIDIDDIDDLYKYRCQIDINTDIATDRCKYRYR